MVEALVQDVRYGLRLVRAYKAFSLTVVLILGLGIGANTAIFSLVDGALLEPLPFADGDRLRLLNGVVLADAGEQPTGLSWPEYEDYSGATRSFAAMEAVAGVSLNLEYGQGTERLSAELITPGYFDLLGVGAWRGRLFDGPAFEVGSRPELLLGYGLARRAFGGSLEAIGRSVRIGGRDLTVVGVLPEGFSGVTLGAQAWISASMVGLVRPHEALEERDTRWVAAIGRLRPGVEAADARQELERIAATLRDRYPDSSFAHGVRMQSLRESYLGEVQLSLVALLASVGGVLLIACANVTNLLLARSASRSSEVAVRLALGARRPRLFRQLLTESVVLALAGGGVGTLIALWGVEGLAATIPSGVLPEYVVVAVDARVFLFTFVVTVATGVLSGLAPALRSSRADAVPSFRSGASGVVSAGARRRQLGLQAAIVTTQISLTVALLICAGVMTRSLWLQLEEEPGFDPGELVAMRLTLPPDGYDHRQRALLLDRLAERLSGSAPAVSAVAFTSDLPFRDGAGSGELWHADGAQDPSARRRFYRHAVSPGFFRLTGIPLLEGRSFEPRDRSGAERVVIVGAAAARALWPTAEPIGQQLRLEPNGPRWTVVGIVGDVKYRNLTDDLVAGAAEPEIYFSTGQVTTPTMEIVARPGLSTEAAVLRVRRAVRESDARLAVADVASLREVLAGQTAMSRLQSTMLTSFGLLGLALGAAGIYGLLAYTVARRQKEIGIRLALGATPTDITRSFVRRGLLLTVPGLVVGAGIGIWAAAAMRGLLHGVGAADPQALAVAMAVVALAAVCASWLPARRAASIDPVATLRAE